MNDKNELHESLGNAIFKKNFEEIVEFVQF